MQSSFLSSYETILTHFNKRLSSLLNENEHSILKDAMNYSVQAGGKRIRPIIVYLVGQLFNVDIKQLDTVALAIECIHTYSLIHDDLPAMDDDMIRRGNPTCHIKFSEADAILAGDALLTLSFSLLSSDSNIEPEKAIKIISTLANASGINGMCLGQTLDIHSEGKKVTELELNKIHSLKTGALITASVEMSLILAGKQSLLYKNDLIKFSQYLGLAFQVQDDVLDVIGKQEITGKLTGQDDKLNKSTYVAILGLEKAQQKAKKLLIDALNILDKIPMETTPLNHFTQLILTRDR